MNKLIPLVITSAVWCIIGWFAHYIFADLSGATILTTEQRVVIKAQQLIQQRYLAINESASRQPITTTIVDAAIGGIFEWSNDPFSDLFGPTATKRLLAGYEATNGITDVNFDIIDGKKVVRSVPPDGPAAVAGLQVGDILLAVDDVEFDRYIGGIEAGLLLRGPADSTYKLKIESAGEVRTLFVKRQRWEYVAKRILDNQIAYLKTEYFFPEQTTTAVEKILRDFQQTGVQALIWDLRNNGGGATESVQKIVSTFRAEGELLFIAEFKDSTQQTFQTMGNSFLSDIPIVVLVNRATGSAGEIAAAAMIPRAKTILMGETTAGKGTIQDNVQLDAEHLLHFTIAKWLTADGEWLEGKGVEPTIYAVDDPSTTQDELIELAIAHLQESRER